MNKTIIIVCLVLSFTPIAKAMDEKEKLFETWKKNYVEMVIQKVNNPAIKSWEETIQIFRPWLAVTITRHIIEHNGGDDLHYFAYLNEPQMLAYLLERKSPDIINALGKTALHIAAQEGNTKAIRCLLKNNADPNKQDFRGNTALHHLAEYFPPYQAPQSWIKATQLLLDYKAEPLIVNDQGETPCNVASNRNAKKLVALLKKAETKS